jgi:hypothetical protein
VGACSSVTKTPPNFVKSATVDDAKRRRLTDLPHKSIGNMNTLSIYITSSGEPTSNVSTYGKKDHATSKGTTSKGIVAS